MGRGGPGFFCKELLPKGGGGPTKGRLFNFDFPSATFWVKIFLGGWVSEPKDPPPPHLINKVWRGQDG